jgi:hypothetical protein
MEDRKLRQFIYGNILDKYFVAIVFKYVPYKPKIIVSFKNFKYVPFKNSFEKHQSIMHNKSK